MRKNFLLVGGIICISTAVLIYFDWFPFWTGVVLWVLYIAGVSNVMQKKHTILRNFPVLGYARYFFEFISPEMQQYFIERNTDGSPFSRNHRSLVYRRAKNVMDTVPFGTQEDVYKLDYEGIRHSIFPKRALEDAPRVLVGGPDCRQPYLASLFNISAMSYGALSNRAISALNLGAKKGKFYHNTGEGSISDHHRMGGDLVWQIGTGYFGCRTSEGNFDKERFREKASWPEVRMIELKLSQGAKPGHGGVLPGVKNTEEIARIRGLEPFTTVLSPPAHSAFNDARGLLYFIRELRELSDGKPVGFKLCLGRTEEFEEICEEMVLTGIKPDFITIDGAEGGTGAAPLEFSDAVGLPLKPALIYVNRCLRKNNLRDDIKIIASGKVLTAASLLKMIALGADLCNSARGFMFALGCIQALRCNSNNCPTGVATQDPELVNGLDVKDKAERVYYFHKNTLRATMELLAATGLEEISQVTKDIFIRGDELADVSNKYFPNSLGFHE